MVWDLCFRGNLWESFSGQVNLPSDVEEFFWDNFEGLTSFFVKDIADRVKMDFMGVRFE